MLSKCLPSALQALSKAFEPFKKPQKALKKLRALAFSFFNTKAFPGKRGMRKSPKVTMEFALIADGVPTSEVYDVLGTEEGIARAFAKLDTIKEDVVWWEAGAQPPQLLADGEVVFSTAWNGRVFNAKNAEGQTFEMVWDGQIYDLDLWVIPKGSKNKEAALDFVAFSTATEQLAAQASWISYGPARASSEARIGTFHSDPSIKTVSYTHLTLPTKRIV